MKGQSVAFVLFGLIALRLDRLVDALRTTDWDVVLSAGVLIAAGVTVIALRNRLARSGWAGFILLGTIAIALAAPLVAPYMPYEQINLLELRLAAPSPDHLLGTDNFSRDLLSRVIYGARLSLALGIFSALVATILGTTYGVIAGMSSGALARSLERVLDALLAVPRLLLLIFLVGFWSRLNLLHLALALAATGWFSTARMVRAAVRSLNTERYVLAARAAGSPTRRTAARHLIPGLTSLMMISATLGVAQMILLEAGLSFLGLGVAPPTPSLGSIIFEGRAYLQTAPWIPLAPGLAILTAVLALTELGDRLEGHPRS